MSGSGLAPAYYLAAQEVRDELGLRTRCTLTDASARQDLYRWCLLFEWNKRLLTVSGDEDGTDPAERELIKHKIRAALFDHINDVGI